MNGIRIRPANPGDLASVAAIECASFPHPWKHQYFEVELQAARRFTRVAVDDGEERIVGYLFAMYVLDEMHVNKIAVAEPFRRRGIALALMEDCLGFARSNGIASISLEVRESNEGARAFYRALAFDDVYHRPRYYPDGEGAVVMMRELKN